MVTTLSFLITVGESGTMNHANNLRKLREAKGLTQPELAELVRLHPVRYQQL